MITVQNSPSIWSDIFHSTIFNRKKCYLCRDTFGRYADITVADPWMEPYASDDRIGSSVLIPHSEEGNSILKGSIENHYLDLIERPSPEKVVNSQKQTLIKKYIYRKYYTYFSPFFWFFKTPFYRSVFFYFHYLHLGYLFKVVNRLYLRENESFNR